MSSYRTRGRGRRATSSRAPPAEESSTPLKYCKHVVRYFEIDIRYLMSTPSGQFLERN